MLELLHALPVDVLCMWLSPRVTHCCNLMPRAGPLCDSFWNVMICRTQHCTFRSLSAFSVVSLYGLDTAQSILSVVGGQCWRLLSCRRPVLVSKADGLPMVFSGHGCGPASYHIPHKCQSEVSVWTFRTTGLQQNVTVKRLRGWKDSFLFHFPFPHTVMDRIANGHCHFCQHSPRVSCSPSQWLASGLFFSHHKS